MTDAAGSAASRPVVAGGRSLPSIDVLVVFVAAAAIRLYQIDALALTHWDEDFFVRNARALAGDFWGSLPDVGWSSGPLTAVVFGLVMKAVGVKEAIPFVVNALAGAAAAAVLTSLGRRLFGRIEGLAAGLLLAASMFAVSYSRLALADSLFLLLTLVVLRLLPWAMAVPVAWRWVTFGLAVGSLLLTKYSGPVIVAVVVAWFTLLVVADARRERRVPWRLVAGCLCGILLGVAIAVAGFVLVNRGEFSQGIRGLRGLSAFAPGGFRLRTTPELAVGFLTTWISPLVLGCAALGAAIALLRRRSGDLLLLIWLAGYGAAMLLYVPFPRLLLPLLPAVFLLAGRAMGQVVAAVRGGTAESPRRHAATLVAAGLIVVTVSAEAIRLPRILRMQTTGYALSAREGLRLALARRAELWWRIQPEPLFALYANDTNAGQELDEAATHREEWRTAVPRVFVVDHSVSEWHGGVAAFLEKNRAKLRLLARFPNPTYDEHYLQMATIEDLRTLAERIAAARPIEVYESTEALEPQ